MVAEKKKIREITYTATGGKKQWDFDLSAGGDGGAKQSAMEWESPPSILGVEELDQVHNSKRDFLL